MTFFRGVFRSKDKDTSKTKPKNKIEQVDTSNGQHIMPHARPGFVSNWDSTTIVAEEVEELIKVCTLIMKSRAEALDTPFLLLPFRPDVDTVPARTFINNFFKSNREGLRDYTGSTLRRELVLTDPAILCSILKWCWSRLPGGVVSWPVYQGFCLGERDSNMARNAFDTFIPISADSVARKNIIYDFYDLLAAVAAHGKTNGHGGRKLSRMAGWWAFEQSGDSKGFEGGYKTWLTAANASSHLFFAYLRSLQPEALDGFTGINGLPRYLQALLAQTEYPPETPFLMQKSTPKVVMLVDSVSPGPFALLRRAKNFEYRDEDLQMFSEISDPVQALTEECRRVLECIASANQSTAQRSHGGMSHTLDNLTSKPDESWSHFSDFGFSSIGEDSREPTSPNTLRPQMSALSSKPQSRMADAGRPTTPSWADFLNVGFVDEKQGSPAQTTLLLPPDKMLPPIGDRPPRSSGGTEEDLNPGELASITKINLDDSFWWVWITSLANEEPSERKAVFGRCALVETGILGGRWIVIEEQVKGAALQPFNGAYIAEKKSRFGFSRRGKTNRRQSAILSQKNSLDVNQPDTRAASATPNMASVTPDQQVKIRAAAATLARHGKKESEPVEAQRRGRHDELTSTKTHSVMTLGLTSEAGPAMKWARAFDKEETRKQYLGNDFAGKGHSEGLASESASMNTEREVDKPLPSPNARVEENTGDKVPQHLVQDQAAAADPHPLTQSREPEVVAEQPKEASYTPQEHRSSDASPISATGPSLNASIILENPVVQEATAAEVPVVSATPTVTKVDRKPVPDRSNNVENHPAFRPAQSSGKLTKETPTERSARQAWEAKALNFEPDILSHEARKTGHGGLKKMFSTRRKEDARPEIPAQSPSMTSLTSTSESNVARKISLLRKKAEAVSPPPPQPKPLKHKWGTKQPVPPTSEPRLQPPAVSPPEVSPTESTLTQEHQNSVDDAPVSPVSYNTTGAEVEFARFAQGPLSDAPAQAPRDSIDSHMEAQEDHKAELLAGHLNAPGGFPETPTSWTNTPLDKQYDGQSGSEPTYFPQQASQQVPNSFDRWAQIRKNAAERTARLSEEEPQRRPSHTNTEDDGETSGEETIEERVARIKARVAHLTGNLDIPNPQAPSY